jgi:hypothetical protein
VVYTNAHAEMGKALQRIAELERDLTESRKATEAVQAAAEIERADARGKLDRQAATILNLTCAVAAEKSAGRQLCGEQVQLVRALRALVDAAGQLSRQRSSVEPYHALAKRVSEALEALALVEVPFA